MFSGACCCVRNGQKALLVSIEVRWLACAAFTMCSMSNGACERRSLRLPRAAQTLLIIHDLRHPPALRLADSCNGHLSSSQYNLRLLHQGATATCMLMISLSPPLGSQAAGEPLAQCLPRRPLHASARCHQRVGQSVQAVSPARAQHMTPCELAHRVCDDSWALVSLEAV